MTHRHLLEKVRREEGDYALIDQYIAMGLKHNISEYSLEAAKTIDIETLLGMVHYHELSKMKICSNKFIKINEEINVNALLDLDKVQTSCFTISIMYCTFGVLLPLHNTVINPVFY